LLRKIREGIGGKKKLITWGATGNRGRAIRALAGGESGVQVVFADVERRGSGQGGGRVGRIRRSGKRSK